MTQNRFSKSLTTLPKKTPNLHYTFLTRGLNLFLTLFLMAHQKNYQSIQIDKFLSIDNH